MPRNFPLFAVTAMLATATPLLAQVGASSALPVGGHVIVLVERKPPAPGQSIWTPVPNVISGESTLDFQYQGTMLSETAFLRVFLGDRSFGLAPDPLTVVPVPDLTGWRKSLAVLEEASHQYPGDERYYQNRQYKQNPDYDIPIRRDRDKSRPSNIDIATEF